MSSAGELGGCAIMLAVAAIIGVVTIAANNHRETHEFVVSSKERQCDSDGKSVSCYYVVFGTEGEVFENSDSGLLNGKWNSASMQARFVPGRRYRVVTTGWRIPMLSAKPNIISMQAVSAEVPLHD